MTVMEIALNIAKHMHFFSVLIPQQPVSFECLTISRRDGTSIAHTANQIDFTPYAESAARHSDEAGDEPSAVGGQSPGFQHAAAVLAKLASADKCNQNVDAEKVAAAPLRQLPAATAAGRAAVDRMSQSVHEARNQIFDHDHHGQRRSGLKKKASGNIGEIAAGPSGAQIAAAVSHSDLPAGSSSHRQHLHQQQRTTQRAPTASSSHLTFALDPSYGVLWSFDSQKGLLSCFNIIIATNHVTPTTRKTNPLTTGSDCVAGAAAAAAAISSPDRESLVRTILAPEIALPSTTANTPAGSVITPATVGRTQAALNVLACLDILTYAGPDSIPQCFEVLPLETAASTNGADKDANAAAAAAADSSNNEYQLVSRFDNFGGGWGYSGHSVEAIRFSADTDIVLYGFAMFGGRGEYTCKLRLYDLGCGDASGNSAAATSAGGVGLGGAAYDEDDAMLLAETEDIPYECPARSKYNIMLPRPINAAAGNWFLVWARISGPSSDCGSAGQATVTTEDQIVFSFATSKKANNGTDVNSGQIPSILYRVVTPEYKAPVIRRDIDPVCAVSRQFANGVSRECFESLVRLLSWSWRTFKETLTELQSVAVGRDRLRMAHTRVSLNRLVYISQACLRLLRKYCNEIYPDGICAASPTATSRQATTTSATTTASDGTSRSAAGNTQIYVLNQGPGGSYRSLTSGTSAAGKCLMGSSMDATTPTAERLAGRKCNTENLQLAECIGDVRALLIQMLCDELPDMDGNSSDGRPTDNGDTPMDGAQRILDECHNTFLACFNVFYPTATLKWNCLCDLLAQSDDRQSQAQLPTRLLSAIVGGLCSPTVKLRHTFQLLCSGGGSISGGNLNGGSSSGNNGGTSNTMAANQRDSKSIVSPSDNSGLPMLTSMDMHQYPVLVEQMIYRTQQEKCFRTNGWTFKDVLVRLLEIIAQPVRCRIENIYNRGSLYTSGTSGQLLAVDRSHNQRLIDNCCQLLTRVLAEIVYETCSVPSTAGSLLSTAAAAATDDARAASGSGAATAMSSVAATAATNELPAALGSTGLGPLYSTGSRFARTDTSRTWNTGNFGPEAICFTVSRSGVSIAGASMFTGSGAYDYQLELLYDTADEAAHAHRATAAGGNSGGGSGAARNSSGGGGFGSGAAHSRWELLETVTGTFDQVAVQGDMADIKFERAVVVRENVHYAIRLCAQGARTCSGDAGMASVRGPCGVTFAFYSSDLSFNGTTAARGQIPCILYNSSAVRLDAGAAGRVLGEQHARETALQIAGDIGRKCTELLVLARNALGSGSGGSIGGVASCGGVGGTGLGGSESSPGEKSLNLSNNTQTIDSEQNITPIEEHLDIGFVGGGGGGGVVSAGLAGGGAVSCASAPCGSGSSVATESPNSGHHGGIVSARDQFSKRIESFSKGLMETLKFGEKRSNNPFEYEIEIGATEIQECQKDERQTLQQQATWKRTGVSNGNAGDVVAAAAGRLQQHQQQQLRTAVRRNSSLSDDETDGEQTCAETLKLFDSPSASIFHTLLPIVFANVGALASHDPKSSVQILTLIRDILPHVSALNQLYASKEEHNPAILAQQTQTGSMPGNNIFAKDLDEAKQHLVDLATTSNHYCIVESDHPYRSANIHTYRVEFPPTVQWFTIEFDPQCGTAQPEDCLLVSIPRQQYSRSPAAQQHSSSGAKSLAATVCRNATVSTSGSSSIETAVIGNEKLCLVRQFNSPGAWTQAALVLPGHRVEFTLETATHYARDPQANKYGFRCLIVGYENPTAASSGLQPVTGIGSLLGGIVNMTRSEALVPGNNNIRCSSGIVESNVITTAGINTTTTTTTVGSSNACLSRLECELAYLGGMCGANLMRHDLVLPGDATAAVLGVGAEDVACSVAEVMQTHATLLSKGLALADSVLTVNQALDTYLPMG